MAIIGEQLLQPESGWRRYDGSYELVKFNGTWNHNTNAENYYHKTLHSTTTAKSFLEFYFEGTKLRIIGVHNTTGGSGNNVYIDDILVGTINNSGTLLYQTLQFEIDNLDKKLHKVRIEKTDSTYFWLDAIDIDIDGKIRNQYKKISIKNPTTNQYYSLAEKTLIPLPDSSSKNMILHGIEAGVEIQLDEAFDKIQYPVNEKTIKISIKPLSIKLKKGD